MTSRFFNYIFCRIFLSTIFSSGILVVILCLTQSLRFLDMIINRDVSLQGYLYLMSFLIPDLLVFILPICLLLCVVFFYNKFQTHHECMIWQSMGMSPFQIGKPAIVLSAIIVLLTFLVNIYVLPPSFRHFKTMEHQLRQQFSTAMLHEGRFNSFKNTTIYIKKNDKKGHMYGIFVYHSHPKQPYTLFAKEGFVHFIHEKPYLVLKNGLRQDKNLKTDAYQLLTFEKLNYNLSDALQTDQTRIVRPYEKSLTDLLSPDNSLDKGTHQRYAAAAHQRILQPFFGIIYVLIALNCLLTSRYRRQGNRKIIFMSFGLAFVSHLFMMMGIHFNGKIPLALSFSYGFTSLMIVGLLLRLMGYSPFPSCRRLLSQIANRPRIF